MKSRHQPQDNKNLWVFANKKILLNNSWVKKGTLIEIGNYLEPNDNENITCKHLWDAAKVTLRRQFIALCRLLGEKDGNFMS